MRLHLMTRFILVVTALRFIANCVSLSSSYVWLEHQGYFPWYPGPTFDVLGSRFQEFADILLYVGVAALVEMLARIHSHLRQARVMQSSLGVERNG